MSEAFDPSSRPRPARSRAESQRVARSGFVPRFMQIKLNFLTHSQLQKLTGYLGASSCAAIEHAMQEIAGEYRRSTLQPANPRGDAVFQLKLAAHLCWKLKNAPAEKDQTELQTVLNSFNDDAKMFAGSMLRVPWADVNEQLLKSHSVEELLAASLSALQALGPKRGDYVDRNLHIAVGRLVELFEQYAGKPATWSDRRLGELGFDGGQSRAAGSECGLFIETFFGFVHPKLPITRPHNALKAYLDGRKRDPAQSF
ncbi:hypothetical protein FHS91_003817 [Sphingobium xanthum]|uniref:hypothetical protein n=1 Tax=Sphingobium xanthum TaxID=1387165 RepID=UPI001C8B7790|nr:hypothetical protein [Sphingobium xanthum]